MTVPGKPAFAIVIAAFAFLAQDLFQRITHITVTNDESVAFVTLLSWVAYYLVPATAQGTVVVVPPQAPLPPAVAK
jgi:hypothetical protein